MNDDTNQRKARIREFLGRFFRHREIGDDEDIFALGFVNSLLAIQLVNFLESDFGIEVADDDLDLDNFRTIARLDALIERKRGGAVAPAGDSTATHATA